MALSVRPGVAAGARRLVEFVARTTIENYVFQPGHTIIPGSFNDQSIPPEYVYYRVRMQLYHCGIYSIYSAPALLCGAATPAPSITPTRTRTATPTSTRTPTRTLTPTNTVPVYYGCNPTTITIEDVPAPSTPYPSNIQYAGTEIVTDVNITLLGLSHTWPDNIDIMLVGPTGQKVLVMSDAGGSTDVVNINVTFDDQAPAPIPDLGPLTAGTYQTSNYEGNNDPFPPPAPTPPYQLTLSAFNGSPASGTWSLYVIDDSPPNVGSISGGWCLYINGGSKPTPTSTPTSTTTSTPTATQTPTSTPGAPTLTPTATGTTTPAQPTATSTVEPALPTPSITPEQPTATLTREPTATPAPTTCTTQFSDVQPGSTFYYYVRCLACRGILGGYADGTFRPGNNMTRGQLSKVVSNAVGFGEPVGSQTFEDVPVGSTFHPFVERLAARGIIGGYPCGGPGEPCVPPQNRPYFRPGANVTRGQTCKIVAEAAGLPDPPSGQQTFEDVPEGHTFWPWIESMAGAGVIGGYPCGGPGEPCLPPQNRPYFRPGADVTRGQAAKIVAGAFFPGCQTPFR